MAETAHRDPPQCGEDILDALVAGGAAGGDGVTVSRLAALIGRDRGVTARVVEDLIDLGLLDRVGARGHVRLGWGLFASGAQIAEVRLETHSQQVLDRLAEACQEAAWLVVRRGAEAISVAEATPELPVQWVSWVGRGFPVARSDASAALLQDFDGGQVRALLGEDRLPPSAARRAPKTVAGLMKLIDAARRRGVSVLDEQAEADVASAAAPVRDFRGDVVAAIVVSGPAVRLRDRLDDVVEAVRAAAGELSGNLGARG